MNADKSSVKTCVVEMILPKPGDVPLKEWTKSDIPLKEWTKIDKDQNCDALEELHAIVKKC